MAGQQADIDRREHAEHRRLDNVGEERKHNHEPLKRNRHNLSVADHRLDAEPGQHCDHDVLAEDVPKQPDGKRKRADQVG